MQIVTQPNTIVGIFTNLRNNSHSLLPFIYLNGKKLLSKHSISIVYKKWIKVLQEQKRFNKTYFGKKRRLLTNNGNTSKAQRKLGWSLYLLPNFRMFSLDFQSKIIKKIKLGDSTYSVKNICQSSSLNNKINPSAYI